MISFLRNKATILADGDAFIASSSAAEHKNKARIAIKRLFKRNPASASRMIILGLVAVGLMFFDHRSAYVKNWHAKFSVVAVPMQVLVDEPIKLVHWLTTTLKVQRQLLDDNARLQAQQLLMESKLQKLLALERENAQLRQLLQSTPQATGKVIVAQLLAVALNPATQQVVIDRGSEDHLYLGQPVLDAYGVMGQVVSIGPLTSRVLLVTDIQSSVPVQNYRTGARAIAIGSGSSGQTAT